jgi:hypothetical protein
MSHVDTGMVLEMMHMKLKVVELTFMSRTVANTMN